MTDEQKEVKALLLESVQFVRLAALRMKRRAVEAERQLEELRGAREDCGHPKRFTIIETKECLVCHIENKLPSGHAAEIAAALERACKTICSYCDQGIPLDEAGHENDRHCYAWAVRKLIDAPAKASLDALLASAEARGRLDAFEDAANECEATQREAKWFKEEKRPPVLIYNAAVCECADNIRKVADLEKQKAEGAV